MTSGSTIKISTNYSKSYMDYFSNNDDDDDKAFKYIQYTTPQFNWIQIQIQTYEWLFQDCMNIIVIYLKQIKKKKS